MYILCFILATPYFICFIKFLKWNLWHIGHFYHQFQEIWQAMNTFALEALNEFSPFQLVFLRDQPDLTSLTFPKIETIPINYREYYNLLIARAQMVGRILEALEFQN